MSKKGDREEDTGREVVGGLVVVDQDADVATRKDVRDKTRAWINKRKCTWYEQPSSCVPWRHVQRTIKDVELDIPDKTKTSWRQAETAYIVDDLSCGLLQNRTAVSQETPIAHNLGTARAIRDNTFRRQRSYHIVLFAPRTIDQIHHLTSSTSSCEPL